MKRSLIEELIFSDFFEIECFRKLYKIIDKEDLSWLIFCLLLCVVFIDWLSCFLVVYFDWFML